MSPRIGLPVVGSASWHGGVTYLEAIVQGLLALPKGERPELWLIAGMRGNEDFSIYMSLASRLDGVIALNLPQVSTDAFAHNVRAVSTFGEIGELVDFIFPVNSDVLPGFSYASWIPDLQHKQLPHFFQVADIQARDESLQFLSDTADIIVFSSKCALSDFQRFYPGYMGVAEVVHFYTFFDSRTFSTSPLSVAQRYGLPEKYVICCNQFWQHKNHDNLLRALAMTANPVHLVCTGGLSDYRNPAWYSTVQDLISELGISARVSILGLIPREDQIQLIRGAQCLVQPSFFEGWSTVLENARGLGKTVLVSDIPVHREQNIAGAKYFNPDSPVALAEYLDEVVKNEPPGTVSMTEESVGVEIRRLQIDASRNLMRIAKAAVARADAVNLNEQSARRQAAALRRMTERLVLAQGMLNDKQAVIDGMAKANAARDVTSDTTLEGVVAEQQRELEVLRLKLNNLGPITLSQRIVRRLRAIIRPRLGNLRQYQPRPITLVNIKSRVMLSARPKVSIVTPSFGQGAFIEQTLLSVLNQRYPALEYFIQDGGSKDETVSVLRTYQSRISGWTSEVDGGQSQAINLGMKKTTGEIMAWLNSDDLLLPGAINAVVDYFNRHPEIDVVYGNRLLVDENGMEIGRWILPGHSDSVLSWADYVPQETLFWRRRIWEKVGGQVDESFRFAMDWDLLVRFRDVGAKFAHIPQFLGAFRIHTLQKTSANINDVGQQEMSRIRTRTLGYVPDALAIRSRLAMYLAWHVCVDVLHRIKTRLGVVK